jgi:hypothetical protein
LFHKILATDCADFMIFQRNLPVPCAHRPGGRCQGSTHVKSVDYSVLSRAVAPPSTMRA